MSVETTAKCPDELLLCVYADDELRGNEAARVEAHADGCAKCRTLIDGLRSEGVLLREVFTEEALERIPAWSMTAESAASRVGRRHPGHAWMGATIAIAVLAPFAFEWAWQSIPRLPAGLSWISSLGTVGGALSLSRGLVRFFVGGQDMVLSSIGFAGTLIVAIGMFAFAAMRARGARNGVVMVAIVLVLLGAWSPSGEARAAEFRFEEEGTVRVDEGETVEDTVFLGGNTAIMAGVIDGDLFAGAEQVEITGTVHGNVYAAGESVRVSGTVDGNVHAAGENVEVSTKVGGSGFIAGQRVTVTENGDLARGAFMAGETVQSRGEVGRDLFFAADEMTLDGTVERNVRGYGTQVAVGATTSIGGDLHVTVPDDDAVEIREGARIVGDTVVNIDEEHDHRPFMTGGFYLGVIAKALAMLLIGWLLVTIFPRLRPTAPESSGEVLKDMGVGFLALVAIPAAMILFLITIIGIPVAIVLGMIYGLLIFLSTLVVADFAGQRLPFGDDTGTGAALRTCVALLIILFITAIPFVGGGLNFLITIFGMGVLLMHLRALYHSRSGSGGTPMGTPGPDAGALPA